jgi:hypothetical protein
MSEAGIIWQIVDTPPAGVPALALAGDGPRKEQCPVLTMAGGLADKKHRDR